MLWKVKKSRVQVIRTNRINKIKRRKRTKINKSKFKKTIIELQNNLKIRLVRSTKSDSDGVVSDSYQEVS